MDDYKKIYDIDFSYGYVELVDGEYVGFYPDENMKNGHDWNTDEPLYDLEYNQFYVIEMESDFCKRLFEEGIEMEYQTSSVYYNERDDKDYHLFLFQDSYDYQYTKSILYV